MNNELALNTAQTVLSDIIRLMGITAEIDGYVDDEGQIMLDIVSEQDLAIIIGKSGNTLNAIEFIVNTIVRNKLEEFVRVVVDACGYRERQRGILVNKAKSIAEMVRSSGENIEMDPMSSRDRRIVHMVLADEEDLVTVSMGNEPNRRIVICLKENEII